MVGVEHALHQPLAVVTQLRGEIRLRQHPPGAHLEPHESVVDGQPQQPLELGPRRRHRGERREVEPGGEGAEVERAALPAVEHGGRRRRLQPREGRGLQAGFRRRLHAVLRPEFRAVLLPSVGERAGLEDLGDAAAGHREIGLLDAPARLEPDELPAFGRGERRRGLARREREDHRLPLRAHRPPADLAERPAREAGAGRRVLAGELAEVGAGAQLGGEPLGLIPRGDHDLRDPVEGGRPLLPGGANRRLGGPGPRRDLPVEQPLDRLVLGPRIGGGGHRRHPVEPEPVRLLEEQPPVDDLVEELPHLALAPEEAGVAGVAVGELPFELGGRHRFVADPGEHGIRRRRGRQRHRGEEREEEEGCEGPVHGCEAIRSSLAAFANRRVRGGAGGVRRVWSIISAMS
ncbi:MAG: hypothetical protein BWX64_00663 [Acidobacteria bacterium ADurb.Bin051]|nr:MAG: hypothetical protein BWX64_00663 [Acidobacteria bacterium ADurb.Bin051]